MPREVVFTDDKKTQLSQIFLLEFLINGNGKLPVLAEGDLKMLEPLTTELHQNRLVEIRDDRYVPTLKGRQALGVFMERFSEFLNTMDVYHSVDLATGDFAMARSFELDDEQWKRYLSEERWEDLRLAVADFKGLDRVEIVFMSFLNEGRFDSTSSTWAFDLSLGTTWDQLLAVCRSALAVKDLAYQDTTGTTISGEDVIRDVIRQGTELLVKLHQQEQQGGGGSQEGGSGSPSASVTETIEVSRPASVVYFDPFFDPFYVGPSWARVYW